MYSDIMSCLGCSYMKALYGSSLAIGISLTSSFFLNIAHLRPKDKGLLKFLSVSAKTTFILITFKLSELR